MTKTTIALAWTAVVMMAGCGGESATPPMMETPDAGMTAEPDGAPDGGLPIEEEPPPMPGVLDLRVRSVIAQTPGGDVICLDKNSTGVVGSCWYADGMIRTKFPVTIRGTANGKGTVAVTVNAVSVAVEGTEWLHAYSPPTDCAVPVSNFALNFAADDESTAPPETESVVIRFDNCAPSLAWPSGDPGQPFEVLDDEDSGYQFSWTKVGWVGCAWRRKVPLLADQTVMNPAAIPVVKKRRQNLGGADMNSLSHGPINSDPASDVNGCDPGITDYHVAPPSSDTHETADANSIRYRVYVGDNESSPVTVTATVTRPGSSTPITKSWSVTPDGTNPLANRVPFKIVIVATERAEAAGEGVIVVDTLDDVPGRYGLSVVVEDQMDFVASLPAAEWDLRIRLGLFSEDVFDSFDLPAGGGYVFNNTTGLSGGNSPGALVNNPVAQKFLLLQNRTHLPEVVYIESAIHTDFSGTRYRRNRQIGPRVDAGEVFCVDESNSGWHDPESGACGGLPANDGPEADSRNGSYDFGAASWTMRQRRHPLHEDDGSVWSTLPSGLHVFVIPPYTARILVAKSPPYSFLVGSTFENLFGGCVTYRDFYTIRISPPQQKVTPWCQYSLLSSATITPHLFMSRKYVPWIGDAYGTYAYSEWHPSYTMTEDSPF